MNVSFFKHKEPLLNTCTLEGMEGTKAVIYPSLGASLQRLSFNNKIIINNIVGTAEAPKLLNSSCSAILFPFANRINDGKYIYNNKSYQLFCNEANRGHAMHGLVYRKEFEVVASGRTDQEARVTFSYTQDADNIGFPFPFTILLTYRLQANSLLLEVTIENIGVTSFPFSLGWHPYFYSTNLDESVLKMESGQEIETNERMIPRELINKVFPNPLSLRNQAFDTGFTTTNSMIGYKTPDYQINLKMEHGAGHQFVQLYTPPHRQSIAIEPMTAATDCYNNSWGIQELKPKAFYRNTWSIEIT